MKIIFQNLQRPKPQVGDRKLIKGVEFVRMCQMYRGAYVVSNGRQQYEWVRLDDAPEYVKKIKGRLVGKGKTK